MKSSCCEHTPLLSLPTCFTGSQISREGSNQRKCSLSTEFSGTILPLVRRAFAYNFFRNETADATHLAEFHQVEGLVADYDITLGHLLGTFPSKMRHLLH